MPTEPWAFAGLTLPLGPRGLSHFRRRKPDCPQPPRNFGLTHGGKTNQRTRTTGNRPTPRKPRTGQDAVLRPFPHRKVAADRLGVSIALHVAGLAYYRLRQRPEPAPGAEIGLGDFHFEADKSEGGGISKADFSLHVALLEPVDPTARQRLAARKYHIQQDVEELLRKAHSGDFDDPGLTDLKRQLHEQINQAIGVRAVSEIIVTDLKLSRSGPQGLALAHAGPLPVGEDSSSPAKPAGKHADHSADSTARRRSRRPLRIGESIRGGLSQFSFDENGTVPHEVPSRPQAHGVPASGSRPVGPGAVRPPPSAFRLPPYLIKSAALDYNSPGRIIPA